MTKGKLNLETKRILLRPFELSDGPRVKKLAGDKAIADTALNIPHSIQRWNGRGMDINPSV